MADDQQKEQNGDEKNDDEARGETSFEEYAGDKKCPECGEPIIEVRATCPNCGYEYKDEDIGDSEAGKEFIAGSAVDEEGNEIPDHETGGGDDEGSEEESGSGTEGSDDDES